MTFPVDFCFGHDKDVVQQEPANVLEVMAFPVADPGIETFDCLIILNTVFELR